MTKIGVLNPGEMGVSVAASAIKNAHQVYWVSHNRSDSTRLRAEQHNLIEIDSLTHLCQNSEIIISVCPPHAAETVAKEVTEQGFEGYYLDANAVSPQRAIRIGQMLESNGIRFIDGGIIGGPAWKPKETMLYLSGGDAEVIAECFSKGPLETRIIGDGIGKASALKMCYAAYTKGTTALLAAILAAAEKLEVRDELYQQWGMDDADFVKQVEGRATRVTGKAWRFEGEMHEIASTFQEASLPNGFHEAAAEVYHRMAGFKNSSQVPPIDDVLKVLLDG
jgi:3-hydroxyisobutyrate dehydrogenase-like beta-hydroxyacid dehydrogenase